MDAMVKTTWLLEVRWKKIPQSRTLGKNLWKEEKKKKSERRSKGDFLIRMGRTRIRSSVSARQNRDFPFCPPFGK